MQGVGRSNPLAGLLSRLPIRLKLTLAFAGVMAVVLMAVGASLYLRFERGLDTSIDQGLRSRAGDVTALIRQADSGLADSGRSPLTERGEGFAQIVDARGSVVDSTPQLRMRPVLTGPELNTARGGTVTINRSALFGDSEPVRLLATPVNAQGKRLIVVVGASTAERSDALRTLLVLLVIGGPVALALASFAGYGVAAAALRPVEAMRRRAAEIEDTEPAQRLPVMPADDEIARLGTTLNEMLGRLEATFDRERTFVSDASHELRTPLAILKTELELALRAGRSRAELYDALRSAATETDRLTQLAEDLLVIARSDHGRLPVQLVTVDAAELLERVRARYARRAVELGRELDVVVQPELVLAADATRLEQALGNMVDNSLRYGDGAVYLKAFRRGECVELRVCDHGPGFPDDFVEHAFERFTRADDARGRGGSGLGLAIVDAIARAHGGRALAANRDGGAVWIELPAAG